MTKCLVADCDGVARTKGLCTKHYMRLIRYGSTDLKGRGTKTKHPFYNKWRHTATSPQGREASWEKFETFLTDVGQPLESTYSLERKDITKPFGPENFEWLKPLGLNINSKTDPKTYGKLWRVMNPRKSKARYYRNQYGISIEQYESMLEEQGHKCAICKAEEGSKRDGKRIALAVDHSHTTGKVRGLLCSGCNTGIGLFKENINLMKRAAAFLRGEELPPLIGGGA